MEIHKLLSRQLKRTFGKEVPQDEKFQEFLHLINQSYLHTDSDRLLLERAMVLSSEELSLANKQLQAEAFNQKELLDKVLEAIVLLARNEQEVALIKELSKSESSYHLLNLVEHLQVLAEEQRRTEKLLLLQEARMSEAQQLANFGTWVYSLGSGETDWTPNLCRIFERDNFIGFDLYNYKQLVYKEDLAEVEYILSTLFSKGITTITHRIVDKNCGVKWIEASFKLIYDANNEPVTILGTALDITRLKQAESALEYKVNELEETSAFLDTLIEEMPVSVLVKDAGTKQYIKMNQIAKHINQHLSDIDFIGKKNAELFNEEKAKIFDAQDDMVIESKKMFVFQEEEYQKKNGSTIILRTQKVPVLEHTGVVKYILTISEDITERKKVENQIRAATKSAEEANRAKSAFLSSMSHELRTPLNAIIGFSQILQRDKAIPVQQKGYVETMYRSGNHLLAMINDVLDISKIEAGKFDLAFEPFSIREILFDIESMFALQAKEKGLVLQIKTHGLLPKTLYSDSKRIQQVLINLIGNAIKFTNSGFVELEINAEPIAETSSYQLTFSVNDSGRGIPDKQLSQIFEPFRQVKGLYSEGTGLGLAISSKIAEMLHGSITVKSKLGKGSTFKFSLDVDSAYDSNENLDVNFKPVVGILGSKKWRILIVDDISNNIAVVRAFLESLGIECIEADNGYDAVMMAELFKPDAIFMDIMMPGMSGEQAFKKIRENPNLDFIKVIALTASGSLAKKEELFAMGFDDYITKPYREKWLIHSLEKKVGVKFIYESATTEGKTDAKEDILSHYLMWFTKQNEPFKKAFLDACDIQDFYTIDQLLSNLNSDETEIIELSTFAKSDDNLFFIELAERISML